MNKRKLLRSSVSNLAGFVVSLAIFFAIINIGLSYAFATSIGETQFMGSDVPSLRGMVFQNHDETALIRSINTFGLIDFMVITLACVAGIMSVNFGVAIITSFNAGIFCRKTTTHKSISKKYWHSSAGSSYNCL